MFNAVLLIAGSIHQGHERFSDVSRGRQCSFMSFSALLFAQSCPVRFWDTATVDQILTNKLSSLSTFLYLFYTLLFWNLAALDLLLATSSCCEP